MKRRSAFAGLASAVALLAPVLAPSLARPAAAEEAVCLAPRELGLWPAPSLPYVLVAVDASSELGGAARSSPSCAGYPADHLGHLRCGLTSAFATLAAEARFGLATGARTLSGCSSCFADCVVSPLPGDAGPSGCGAEPAPIAAFSSSRAGARVVVPIAPDDFWSPTPTPSNVEVMRGWVDGTCTDGAELFADGPSGANGLLRDARRYLASAWIDPAGGPPMVSPLGRADQGERACRELAVVLILGGDEACDDPEDAPDAAAALRAGFEKDGLAWSARTFVLTFGGASAAANAIASAGGTGQATLVESDEDVEAALVAIVDGLRQDETCDNLDNDCNGCTDEGAAHFCNTNEPCCPNATPEERQACLAAYGASVAEDPPLGDLSQLPCVAPAASFLPASWLCIDPGDTPCDGLDDNCNQVVDDLVGQACVPEDRSCGEGVYTCGADSLACVATRTETCNGVDDDCDGAVDDGACEVEGERCVAYGEGQHECAAACASGQLPCEGGLRCVAAVATESGEPFDACVAYLACEEESDCAGVSDFFCGAEFWGALPCHDVIGCACLPEGFCGPPPCRDAEGNELRCDAPTTCMYFGPRAGTCAPDDCFRAGCLNCGQLCTDAGECVDDPCNEGSCILPERPVCKPTADFSAPTCVGSCAGVRCPEGEVCVRGRVALGDEAPACAPAPCGGSCAENEACDPALDACVPDLCVGVDCGPPGCCDPLTGACVACPCEGVRCPAGETCDAESGDCVGTRGLGQPCAVDRDCGSAYCVDGVCCDGPCEGGCTACSRTLKGTGENGRCEPVAEGVADPRQECVADLAETCQETGLCDGRGGCARYPEGTVCALNRRCDEAGACILATCRSNRDCGGSDVCDAEGACVPRPTEPGGCSAAGRAAPGSPLGSPWAWLVAAGLLRRRGGRFTTSSRGRSRG